MTVRVHSGWAGRGEHQDYGPIPSGSWQILYHPKDGFYRLDAIDARPRNDTHEPTGRDKFRLHHPGASSGCVTAKDWAEWQQLDAMLKATRTFKVTDYNDWRRRRITFFGELRVIN